MKPHLDVGRGYVQDLGGLLRAELFEISEHDDDPVRFRKRQHRFFQGFRKLVVQKLFKRRIRPFRQFCRRLSPLGREEIVQGQFALRCKF